MADDEGTRPRWGRVRMTDGRAADELGGDVEDTPTRAEKPRGTFIASGAIFDGTLTLKGDFVIDTEFRGELATDGLITIGPNGSVVGDIRAREVVIRGAVVGNVTAPRQLVVESTGRLHGNIETACLEIQKRAFFRGTTTMVEPLATRRGVDAHPPGTRPSGSPEPAVAPIAPA